MTNDWLTYNISFCSQILTIKKGKCYNKIDIIRQGVNKNEKENRNNYCTYNSN